MTATAADLLPFLQDRRVTVFAGAGISVLPPSCLPSWWSLNHAVLDSLGALASEVTPAASDVIAAVKEKQDAGRMPPEYTSEVITDSFAEDYFEVLRCLEGERTNRVHAWLAALVRAKRLPAIVTTNFDTLIERACEAVGAPLRVLVKPDEYEAVDIAAHLADTDAPTLLVKLHGTATDPTTCIDTLAQRKKGLPPVIGQTLRELVEQTRLCVLGYSGADLEAEPNYLYLRQSAAREETPGFDWLMLPDSAVSPAVQSVVELYNDQSRARIVRGTLPDWLEPWSAALDGTGVEPPAPPADIDVDAVRAEAVQDLQNAAREWATQRKPLGCALVVGLLAERVDPQLTMRTREEALAWADINDPHSRLHGIVLMNLGRCLGDVGRQQDAAELMQKAMKVFEDGGHVDALGSAVNEYAHLLRDVGRYPDAEEVYREALRLAELAEEPIEERAVTRLGLAKTIFSLGRVEEALGIVQEVINDTASAGDETNRAVALEHLGVMLRDVTREDEALAAFREAETVRRRLGQDDALIRNLGHAATIPGHRGELDEAHRMLDEAEQLADRLNDREGKAMIAIHRAGLMTYAGDFPEAIEQLRVCVAMRRERNDVVGQLEAIGNIVGLLASNGRADEAIQEGESAIENAEKLGVIGTLGEITANVGIAWEMKGDLDRAVAMYERAHDLATSVGDRRSAMMASANLGNVRYREGRHDEALDLYQQTLDTAAELGDHNTRIRTLANVANIQMLQEKLDDALATYQQALTIADEQDLHGVTGHVWLNLGLVQLRTEEWAACVESLTTAAGLLADQGDRPNAGLAAWYRVHALLQLHQVAEARASVEEALAQWDGLDHPLEADARSALDQLSQTGQQ